MKGTLTAVCTLIVSFCALALMGCADEPPTIHTQPTEHHEERQCIEHVGHTPDVFKKIVEENVFKGITAFDGRLLKAERSAADQQNRTVTQKVEMMDLYGKELASYTVSSDDAYHVTTLTATDDGGFLFVLGFQDYAYGQGAWASDHGFASRIIKCDKDGQLQFDTPLDSVEGYALQYCFEKDRRSYFFGEIQTPETKTQGVHSYTDIYMMILDENGTVLKSKCIAGSNFDSLSAAEATENGFILSVGSQSRDGDFEDPDPSGSRIDWVITVDDSLEITEKEKVTGRDHFDPKIGETEEGPVYRSDDRLKDFDAGTPSVFIDYGDLYLIVSDHVTGVYEDQPPMLSSIWYYTETVYSAYDHDGDLIFRTAVDSSPDYDAMAQEFRSFSS